VLNVAMRIGRIVLLLDRGCDATLGVGSAA
jgi:hypothetical protein